MTNISSRSDLVRLQRLCGQDLALFPGPTKRGESLGMRPLKMKLTLKLPHIYLPDVIHMVNELSIFYHFSFLSMCCCEHQLKSNKQRPGNEAIPVGQTSLFTLSLIGKLMYNYGILWHKSCLGLPLIPEGTWWSNELHFWTLPCGTESWVGPGNKATKSHLWCNLSWE